MFLMGNDVTFFNSRLNTDVEFKRFWNRVKLWYKNILFEIYLAHIKKLQICQFQIVIMQSAVLGPNSGKAQFSELLKRLHNYRYRN